MPVSLPVQIDRASPVPLYHQLAEQLSAAIDTGTLSPGDPFENELALAERLGLSRPTVRRAIAELVTQGLLVRRRGIGTTVAKQMVHRRAELTSLYEDLARERPPAADRGAQPGHRRPGRARRGGVRAPTAHPAGGHGAGALRRRHARSRSCATGCRPQFADLTREQLQADGLYALLRARGRTAGGGATDDRRPQRRRARTAGSCACARPSRC